MLRFDSLYWAALLILAKLQSFSVGLDDASIDGGNDGVVRPEFRHRANWSREEEKRR
jgi:hypothetical protein